MSLTSYGFIIFAAAVLIIYYILPQKVRWMFLLASSVVFYCFSGPKSLFFILTAITSVYFCAAWIDRINSEKFDAERYTELSKDEIRQLKNTFKEKQKRRTDAVSALCVALNISLLVFVKISSITGALGISFYTLTSFGYLFDVKRKKYAHEGNFFRLALFLSFFPALVQGPINRYDILGKTLFEGGKGRDRYSDISFGLLRMAWGFFKKLVIADRIAVILQSLIEDNSRGIYVLACVIFYAVRLYGDFTGGMDIALGFSEALGIVNSENFERPYFSKSIAEYWRRWHITLGTWMKDYIFYPISVSKPMLKLSKSARERLGNGLGKRVTVYMSTVTVWLLTGLWHGIGANFIVWGMLNCIIILISQELTPVYKKFHAKFPKLKGSSGYSCFEIVRTFFLMGFLRMLDCYTDVGDYFCKIFSIFTDFIPKGFSAGKFLTEGFGISDYIIVLAGCALIFIIGFASEKYARKGKNIKEAFIRDHSEDRSAVSPLIPAAAALLFIAAAVLGAYGKGYNVQDFIYMKF